MKKFLFSISAVLLHLSSPAQWMEQSSNTNFNLNDVFFTSDSVGMAVGDNGRFVKTTDGGNNWIESNQFPGCNSYAIHFATADSGWVAGTCGIYFTNDGGLNWMLQTPGNEKVINDIFFYGNLNGWAVGDEMTFLRTTDGGINWSVETLASDVPNNPMLAVHFRDAANGWIGGGDKLRFTTDGGLTWTHGSSLLIDWTYSMDFGDDYAGVAAGMGGSSTYTFDWGSNWDFNGSITTNNQAIYGVDFSSSSSVYAVGANGLIYYSANAGSTWAAQVSGVTNNLNAVHFPSSDIGYAVGDNGIIIKYDINHSETGVSEDYSTYPNPGDGLINIQMNTVGKDIQISLKNSMGNPISVDSKSTPDKLEIDMRSLPPGIYTLEIIPDQNTKVTKRLLKL